MNIFKKIRIIENYIKISKKILNQFARNFKKKSELDELN